MVPVMPKIADTRVTRQMRHYMEHATVDFTITDHFNEIYVTLNLKVLYHKSFLEYFRSWIDADAEFDNVPHKYSSEKDITCEVLTGNFHEDGSISELTNYVNLRAGHVRREGEYLIISFRGQIKPLGSNEIKYFTETWQEHLQSIKEYMSDVSTPPKAANNTVDFMEKLNEKEAKLHMYKAQMHSQLYMGIVLSILAIIDEKYLLPENVSMHKLSKCFNQATDELLADEEFINTYGLDKDYTPSEQLLIINRTVDRVIELFLGDEFQPEKIK
jgi:hypothetical protein